MDKLEETNLWLEVGNKCLQRALSILEIKSCPGVEATEAIKNLVETAISIDILNLQWQEQNRFRVKGISEQLRDFNLHIKGD